MISASKVALAEACPAAFALPHRDERHAGQDDGNDLHSDLETKIGAGDIPDVLAERWPDFEWRSEVTFAIDLATGDGRELGQALQRDYSAAATYEVVGTADIVGIGPLGQLVIVDRKSFDPRVPRAAYNAQLHTLALAASRARRVITADVAIWHEMRPFDVAELGAFDLDSWFLKLREIVINAHTARDRMERGEIEPTPGSHCRYCPAFHACPKQRDLLAMVKSDAISLRVENGGMPLEDDADAADAYELAKRIRLLLKRIETTLYARANERPIPLPGGRMFGPVTSQGNEQLDGDVTYAVVKELHGQAIADAAVERKATKTKLKAALGFVGAKSVAAAERKVLETVRARGGSQRKTTTRVEEYEPQQLLHVVNE